MQNIKKTIEQVKGKGIVIRGNDIDTDQIIPARFMKVVTFDGLEKYAFYDLRYNEDMPKPHPLNEDKYKEASILIVNRNFGCGSSREHAPQALMRSGIKAIIGESFGEIFAGNATAMGVPVMQLSNKDILNLMDMVEKEPSIEISIDLSSKTLLAGDATFTFEMNSAYLRSLLEGTWDSTSVLLSNLDKIKKTAQNLPYLNDFK